jgi:methionyl-tRNA synthetase
MVGKYCDSLMPENSDAVIDSLDWQSFCDEQVKTSITAMEHFDLAGAIGAAMAIVRRVDAFINDTAPFKLAKDDSNDSLVAAILHRCVEAVRIAACLLEAVLPEKVAELRLAWTLGDPSGNLASECRWGRLEPGTPIAKVALFPRVESPE